MTKYASRKVEGNENLVGDLISSYNALRAERGYAGKKTTKRDAIKDISREYGISQSKVSRILSGAENDGMHVYSRKGFYDSFKNETMADTMRDMLNENIGVSQVAKGLGVSNKFVNSVLREYSAPIYNKTEAATEKSEDSALESKLAALDGPRITELENEAKDMPNAYDAHPVNAEVSSVVVESKPAEAKPKRGTFGKMLMAGAAAVLLGIGLGNYSGCKNEKKSNEGFNTVIVNVTDSENSVVDEYYARKNVSVEAKTESPQNLEGAVSCSCREEVKVEKNTLESVVAPEAIADEEDTQNLVEGKDYVIVDTTATPQPRYGEEDIVKINDRAPEERPEIVRSKAPEVETEVEMFYENAQTMTGAGLDEVNAYCILLDNAKSNAERKAVAEVANARIKQIRAATETHKIIAGTRQ